MARADLPPHPRPARDGAASWRRPWPPYFGYSGVTFAGPGTRQAGDLNEVEVQFYEFVAQYELYWASEPRFDATNTRAAVPDRPCPPVDAAMVRRLIDFAVRDGWGRAARKKRPVAEAAAS